MPQPGAHAGLSRKRYAPGLLLALILAACDSPAPPPAEAVATVAPTPGLRIVVTVVEEGNENPIAGATVSVVGATGRATADSAGHAILNVQPGQAKVIAEASGYQARYGVVEPPGQIVIHLPVTQETKVERLMPQYAGGCTLVYGAHDATALVTGGGSPRVCAEIVIWDSTWAAATTVPTGTRPVCTFDREGAHVSVVDSGGQIYGSQLCTAFKG